MEIILTILLLLALGVIPLLWILLVRKRGNTTAQQIINPLARGPRYRDGIITYNQSQNERFNIEVEDPRGLHSARYQRRHASKQHNRTKPWEK